MKKKKIFLSVVFVSFTVCFILLIKSSYSSGIFTVEFWRAEGTELLVTCKTDDTGLIVSCGGKNNGYFKGICGDWSTNKYNGGTQNVKDRASADTWWNNNYTSDSKVYCTAMTSIHPERSGSGCRWTVQSECENANSGYKCIVDENNCYIKGDPVCEWETEDECKNGNPGYNCIKDEKNCYVKGDPACEWKTENECKNGNPGYNCIKDEKNCYIKGEPKNVDNNPKTGTTAIFIAWIVSLGTLIYAVIYFRRTKFN